MVEMAAQLVHVAGKVLQTKKQSFGTGDRVFKFLEASVQTDVASILEVRFTDDWEGEVPRVGDLLDLDVEVGAFAGRGGVSVNYTAVQPHTEDFILSLKDSYLSAVS